MRTEGSASKYALISVYDKTKLELIVETLQEHKIGMIGSGGTAEAIRKMGHSVLEVSKYTGSEEMPGGLVKTLHPKIHAGILGDWNDLEQRKYLAQNSVTPLDFVIVNLYPFQDVVRKDPSNLHRVVDNIDIGGVTLIRASAKGALLNHRVVPITSPEQYEVVINELSRAGHIGDELRWQLAQQAFAVTADYEAAIRDYLRTREWKN